MELHLTSAGGALRAHAIRSEPRGGSPGAPHHIWGGLRRCGGAGGGGRPPRSVHCTLAGSLTGLLRGWVRDAWSHARWRGFRAHAGSFRSRTGSPRPSPCVCEQACAARPAPWVPRIHAFKHTYPRCYWLGTETDVSCPPSILCSSVPCRHPGQERHRAPRCRPQRQHPRRQDHRRRRVSARPPITSALSATSVVASQ